MHPVLFHIGAILIPSYGALAALGVLLALFAAQRTALVTRVAPSQIWNLCVIVLFAAIIGSRLLLVIVNWRDLLRHPLWMLGLAMVHNPLLAAAAVLVGLAAGFLYARWQHMPLLDTADALAAPILIGLAFEQLGALLAGSGYGLDASVPWAIVYTHPLAARWSGTPLGVPVHPVQAYAGVAFLTLALLLVYVLPSRRQRGDIAGMGLFGLGVAIFVTEMWRDREGRGAVLHGALDGPQIAALCMLLAGALLLRESKTRLINTRTVSTTSQEARHG